MNLAHNDKKRAEYIRFGHLSRFSTKRSSQQPGLAKPIVYAGLLAYGLLAYGLLALISG